MFQVTGSPFELRRRPRAIFFDLDQTLLQHTQPVLVHARTALLQLLPDLPAQRADVFEVALAEHAGGLWSRIAEWSGQGEQALTQIIARALQRADYDPALASPLLHKLLALTADSIELSPGAAVTLEALAAAGIATGIITNGFSVFQNYKARHHGLLDRVQVLVCSEDAGAHKPDQCIFELALKRLNVRAADAWYVGDSPDKDIAGAVRCGITSILYDPQGHYGAGTCAPEPDCVIDDLREILNLAVSATKQTHA